MEFLMELPLLCLAVLIPKVANVHMQYLLYVDSWCALYLCMRGFYPLRDH